MYGQPIFFYGTLPVVPALPVSPHRPVETSEATLNNARLEYKQFDERLSWKAFYESALCERDPRVLPQRIADAQKAIAECALALLRANIDNEREKENLANARRVLEDLKRLYPATKDAA